MTTNVTVLHFAGCPSWETALERVHAAAEQSGVVVSVSVLEVETHEDAERLGFTGSPTIWINGTDAFPRPDAVPALACRLYETAEGLAGSPTVVQLVDALRQRTPSCWCCGHTFEEQDLTRLGAHPEVGLCAGCAQWLNRRARAGADIGRSTPGLLVRRAVAAVRDRVVRAGAQDWPAVGPLLRRLDSLLP